MFVISIFVHLKMAPAGAESTGEKIAILCISFIQMSNDSFEDLNGSAIKLAEAKYTPYLINGFKKENAAQKHTHTHTHTHTYIYIYICMCVCVCVCFWCNLCLDEKIQILLYSKPEKLLNKRCELIARCRHMAKIKLQKININNVS